MTNLYPYSDQSATFDSGTECERYILRRDGREVMRGTELACWKYLHCHHGYSVSHALLHEGYSMEREPKP